MKNFRVVLIALLASLSGLNAQAATKTKPPLVRPAVSGALRSFSEKFRALISTQVGYSGGKTKNLGYEDVSSGDTGHAETLELQFDPAKVSFRDLLVLFFKMHDPTTANRQGNDSGTQYRLGDFLPRPRARKVSRRAHEPDRALQSMEGSAHHRAETPANCVRSRPRITTRNTSSKTPVATTTTTCVRCRLTYPKRAPTPKCGRRETRAAPRGHRLLL